MFKFARNREVLWPVTVQVPMDGGPQKAEISIRYRLLTLSEVAAVAERQRAEAGAGEADQEKSLLLERVTGWDGITDEDGNALPFSTENLEALLDHLYLRIPIQHGLYAASRGAVEKN